MPTPSRFIPRDGRTHPRTSAGPRVPTWTFFRAVDPSGPVLPIVLIHGWPDSFWRYTKLVPLLADPRAHGADPAGVFDVIVPDIPGFGYSDRPGTPLDSRAVADL